VTSANIVDGEGVAELNRSLAELPPDQVKGLIEAMATNPSMLGEDTPGRTRKHPWTTSPTISPQRVRSPERRCRRWSLNESGPSADSSRSIWAQVARFTLTTTRATESGSDELCHLR